MKRVHLISVVLDLSFAIREKGYDVSTSAIDLSEEDIAHLRDAGVICHGNGWFPEKMTKDIQYVVAGTTVGQDNPEIIRAKELGLLIMSIPEFIYQRTKGKTRLVVAGSNGRSGVLSLVAYALQQQKTAFDYALSSEVDSLPNKIGMSYTARIAIIEGGEQITSVMEKRFQLEFYRPHIALLTDIDCSKAKDPESLEKYIQIYRNFAASIEREGKLIYFNQDPVLTDIAEKVREDITSIAYQPHTFVMEGETAMLDTRYGNFPVGDTSDLFLANLNAARFACRHLGMKDVDFYKAVSEYSLSKRP